MGKLASCRRFRNPGPEASAAGASQAQTQQHALEHGAVPGGAGDLKTFKRIGRIHPLAFKYKASVLPTPERVGEVRWGFKSFSLSQDYTFDSVCYEEVLRGKIGSE